ncbi:hypothetical protein CYMTET_32917 [Cymbomonas tetramitiformis]|uniref:Uncharacterized protein n=1 Tax=Cymbomonas tetramitiformis TaxID=36881 RepID=A0AAE0FE43_9CHLO|nr:hypothetical protein CYMTET_32917 [Cymbomonas tetramitiformis]
MEIGGEYKHRLLVSADKLQIGELSDEEKARRERVRAADASGIVEYFWSEDSGSILIPASDKLGSYVSFVKSQNLFILELASKKVFQVTSDGEGPIKNAMAEFVAQEEMDRMTGYWWSPDESAIAFIRVDESHVQLMTRNEIYHDGIKMTTQRYPEAGNNNCEVELGIVNLQDIAAQSVGTTPHVRWVDLGGDKDIYLARVKWLPDTGTGCTLLSFQVQTRNQKELDLRLVDSSGAIWNIVEERSATYVNLTHDSDCHYFKDPKFGAKFLWASERSGFKHLYVGEILMDPEAASSQVLKPLYPVGEWQVDKLEFVDEADECLYFTGRRDTVLERHLYKISLKGLLSGLPCDEADVVRVTSAPGLHNVVFAESKPLYLDHFCSLSQPPQVGLYSLQDGEAKFATWVEKNDPKGDTQHPLHGYYDMLQTEAEFGTLDTCDSTGHALHYRLFKPRDFDCCKKYPVLVFVYGGPHVQVCTNGIAWRDSNFFLQFLLQQGYLVFSLDNRGSANKGKAFEEAIYGHLSELEVLDQIQGLEFLRGLPYVDSANIAMYGHSYGGYMSLMCLFRAPTGYLKAAVAGAPVADWKLYDTHYTERYNGTPQDNSKGYEASSVIPYVKNYDDTQSRLFMYHGMADDNVLFSNSTQVYKELQELGKVFQAMDYPGNRTAMAAGGNGGM